MIRVKNISKSYSVEGRALQVLNNFSIEFDQGTITALVGPSGCGKSTFVRLMSGLEVPDDGHIDFGAIPRNATISVAFQDHGLLEWRTVRQNIMLPLELKGLPVDHGAIDSLVRSVGLQGFEDVYPDQLSGGMKSRASLARALVLQAPVVLLDEPFRSLDEITRFEVANDALELLRSRRQTVIFVTHSVSEAVRLADAVAVVTPRPMRVYKIYKVDTDPEQRKAIGGTEVAKIITSVQAALAEVRV